MTLAEIQNEVVKKYRIKLDPDSKCWGRMHAHIRQRRVCKWKQKSSLPCTFDLFHEIGHIETTESWMRRAEEEYAATCWAIDRFHEYGLEVPEKTMEGYDRYIQMEVDRGKRRGGKAYGVMDIYRHRASIRGA